eukprot:4813675-Alexandrium_andersonii.AAC.1
MTWILTRQVAHQYALRIMRHRLRRSELELRGAKKSLKVGPRSSRGVRSAPFFTEIPNPPTEA